MTSDTSVSVTGDDGDAGDEGKLGDMGEEGEMGAVGDVGQAGEDSEGELGCVVTGLSSSDVGRSHWVLLSAWLT